MFDYYIRHVALPRKVEGVSIPNDDGTFDIYLNSLLPPERQAEVLQHELRHLKAEHFYLDMPISAMERQAEGEALNVILHPPAGHIPCFHSEEHLSLWLKNILSQNHINL